MRAIWVAVAGFWMFCAGVGMSVGQSAPAAGAAVYEDHNQGEPKPLKLSSISGEIRDPAGIPFPGAAVTLFTEESHAVVATVTSGKDGHFSFEKMQPGFYRVVARLPGLCTANVPVKLEPFAFAHHKFSIVMQPAGLDTCSYGTEKK